METAKGALLSPGQHITPGLQLVRELGKGGMASIWVAHHATLQSDVAVKFLAERSLGMPDAVERFSLEAAAAARVRSPHVVQVFDHGVSDGMPYIVMELLEGEDLAHRLERDGRLSQAETVSVIEQICKALERAHAQGIVHRDVKPANVFLVSGQPEGPLVKVLDFGLAKHGASGLSDLTSSGAIFGTPHYMSPEQAASARAVTPQSDLWSVAVIAYECLTGRRPFPAESLIELCVALATSRFDPATSACPELSPGIDAWFTRAFRREPSERFPSATELATSFERALTSVPDPAAPVTVPLSDNDAVSHGGRAALSSLRSPAVVVALLAAAVLAATSYVGLRTREPVATPEPAARPVTTPVEVATVAASVDPPAAVISPAGPTPGGSPPAASVAVKADAPRARGNPTTPPRASARAAPATDDLFSEPKR